MISPARGIQAGRYWQAQLAQQREHAAPIDQARLLALVRDRYAASDEILATLRRDGVATIADYWSPDQCAQAREELEGMLRQYPASVRKFSNGADQRMFGVEMAGVATREFHDDPFLRSIGELVGGFGLYNFATLGARIDATPENFGSGEGWHRDAFGCQFKAFVYLCDVTDRNGPLQYLSGSHRLWRVMLESALGRLPVPPESRMDAARMADLIGRQVFVPKQIEARAGTVILANTAGMHAGSRLLSGRRYALTNYYYHPYQIGKTLVDKFLPMIPGAAERLAPFVEAESRD